MQAGIAFRIIKVYITDGLKIMKFAFNPCNFTFQPPLFHHLYFSGKCHAVLFHNYPRTAWVVLLSTYSITFTTKNKQGPRTYSLSFFRPSIYSPHRPKKIKKQTRLRLCQKAHGLMGLLVPPQ